MIKLRKKGSSLLMVPIEPQESITERKKQRAHEKFLRRDTRRGGRSDPFNAIRIVA